MNWHIYALCYELEQVYRGNITRLNVNFPPRMLKSIICSVAFPAFLLGLDPTKRIIVICYGNDLATKLANDFRTIINSSWYRRIFPATRISRNKNSEFEVVTTQNGFRLAVSIDGALTGRGGDIIILDDPLKAMDARSDSKRERVNELFTNTIYNRLDDKKVGAIIVPMQRLHPNDLSGFVQRSSDEWKTLSFPAIAEREERIQIGPHQFHERHVGDVLHPEREPLEILERIRSQMSAEDFAAQYQQNPIPPGGFLIKRAQIQYCDELPRRTSSSIYLQSWDTAQKPGETNARSACLDILVEDHNFFIARALVGQWEYEDLEQQVILRANEQRPDVILIEDTGFGTALISTLKQRKLPIVAVTPEGDKKTRLLRQISKFTSRQIFLLKTAPGRSELEDELFSFPGGRRNDLVDALTQALGHNHIPALLTEKSVENYGNFLAGLALRGVGF